MGNVKPSLFKVQRGRRLARGLVGAWTFFEAYKSIINEVSGTNSSYDGTLTGLTGTPTWVGGADGWSLLFTAANTQYVLFPAGTATSYAFANTTFSFYIRFKLVTAGALGFLIACDLDAGATGAGWGCAVNPTSTVGMSSKNGGGLTCCSATTTTTYNDGLYHNVVGVLKTDTVTAGNNLAKIYVDGQLTTGAAGANVYGPPALPLRLGTRDDGTGNPITPFGGNISAFYIWNRELPSDEVQILNYDPFHLFRRRVLLKTAAAPIVTTAFRRTASRIGTRSGTRQTWAV